MGKRLVTTIRRALSVGMACAKALPFGHTVKIQRSVQVHCGGCGKSGIGLQTMRIHRLAVAQSDPDPPDGWGVRYQRREGSTPAPTYYCGTCAEAVATGKLKV